MPTNKDIEFVVNLDRNVDDLLREYKKDYSILALLPIKYKINYVIIYISVVIAILSCVVATRVMLLGIIFFAIAVASVMSY